MVRLNKNQLSKELLDELFLQLNNMLGALKTKQIGLFLHDLLGPEERIMLAKRLAIIVMVKEGHSLYKIAQTLKVSPTTAEKIREEFEDGSLDNLLSLLKKHKTDYLAILDTIDSILHFGGLLPHYGQTYTSEAYKKNRR